MTAILIYFAVAFASYAMQVFLGVPMGITLLLFLVWREAAKMAGGEDAEL